MIECLDCGHIGDAFEATFFMYENNEPPYVLQCVNCESRNVKENKQQ